MNKSLLIGLVAGASVATGVGAVTNFARDRALAESPAQFAPPSDSRGTVVRDTDRLPTGLLGEPSADAGASRVAAGRPAAAAAEPSDEETVTAAPRVALPRPTISVPAAAPEPALQAMPVRARFAEVVDVQPVTQTMQDTREVCTDVPVTQQAPARDEHRVAGTLVGAVIGGLLGNQVGGGNGRKIATIAGAAAGGYAGNRVQDRVQQSNTVTTTERQCQTVTEPREETIAYDVTYSYEGETRTVRMNHDPGRRLPAREGRVLLTANAR